ncbi:hypothetical protein LX32DRAFT_243366 [Colletotrichum zoysiae]|uniref:Uncharacterized protein n=1 Tax=Colletotrichum zoysiae TaxID=1216348 RepID=A0AAD9LUE2_9PEZI|nr:hypothetical protein LX32DRAFT_243366 [Colletotrichum zoysiae]
MRRLASVPHLHSRALSSKAFPYAAWLGGGGGERMKARRAMPCHAMPSLDDHLGIHPCRRTTGRPGSPSSEGRVTAPDPKNRLPACLPGRVSSTLRCAALRTGPARAVKTRGQTTAWVPWSVVPSAQAGWMPSMPSIASTSSSLSLSVCVCVRVSPSVARPTFVPATDALPTFQRCSPDRRSPPFG